MLVGLEIPLTIYTENHRLIYDILGESRGRLGVQKQLSKALTVRYDGAKIRTTVGLAEMVQITLIVTESLDQETAVALLVDWVIKTLRTKQARVTKLEIGKVNVGLDENKIRDVVLEKIDSMMSKNRSRRYVA
ncbi:MAG TPA: hypothetical protein VLV31_10685 [Candidatus Acidoferrales bacterium]|nr:hypothetical protein [Candidatus Acidoferrales bacterium]